MKTLIITPACNEEKHLPELIQSMVVQSLLPSEWIIIDDGSVDATSDIIKKASIKYSWIKYLRKNKIGVRSPGKSVMEVFYYGLKKRKTQEFDIVMKIDADLVFPKNYIKRVVSKFNNNPKVGICGGVCVVDSNNKHVLENYTNLDHVRGALKAYRRACFESIGGLVQNMGWDTIDEHHARFKNWEVCVLTDLNVLHRRSTNQDFGFVNAAFRNGKMLYSIRMDIFLLLTNCIKKLIKYPYFILSFALFYGYIYAFFSGCDRIVNKELGVFIRKYRYNKIIEKFLSIFT